MARPSRAGVGENIGSKRLSLVVVATFATMATLAIASSPPYRLGADARSSSATHLSAKSYRVKSLVPTGSARVPEGFGRGALRFEPNLGQTIAGVKFLARGPGYSVFLTPTEALFAIPEQGESAARIPVAKQTRARRINPNRDRPAPIHYSVVRMALEGARANPSFEPQDQQSGRINYFIGKDPKKWQRNVPIYSRVKLREVYPGIDLVYRSSEEHRLEYDLVVAPGADPNQVKISFAGIDSMKLAANGDLILGVNGRELTQRAPVVYQEIGGVRKVIAAHYELHDKHRTSIQLADYDHAKPLVIDPALIVWSSYFGGTVFDAVNAVAVRPNNGSDNIYLTGNTMSPNLEVLANPAFANLTANGGNDAYVAEVSHDGTQVIYYSYLGGHQDDFGYSIAVDNSGNAYVGGRTFSDDYPTTPGVVQESYSSVFSSGFVTEIKFDGSNLVYSTYVHGFTNNNFGSPPVNGNNSLNGIAVDGVGNAYVTGWTDSLVFPTTSGAFQTRNGGIIAGMPCEEDDCEDAFVSELNAGATAFVFSTYLGGEEQDRGLAITVQGTRPSPTAPEVFTPFVTGFTYSTMFPVTPNAFQPMLVSDPNFPGDGHNSFVTEVKSDGTALLSSTYLGGGTESSDVGAIAATIDSTTPGSKMVCVTGGTNSPGFPVCGSGDPAVSCSRATLPFEGSDRFDLFANPEIGYITCFNFDGNAFGVTPTESTALAYSTLLGGTMDSQSDEPFQAPTAIQIDDCDNVYVTGYTDAADFPVSSTGYAAALSAPMTTLGGENATNAFLTVLGYDGSPPTPACNNTIYSPCSPIFSTYLGGSGTDRGEGLVLDLNDNIIVGGFTSGATAESDDFPTTQGSLLPNYPGSDQAGFLTKYGVLPGECKVVNCAVAVAVTSSGASSASAGQTVPAGTFTLTNLCASPVFITDAQVTLTDPALFASFNIGATVKSTGTQSFAPGTPAGITKFTFPQAVMLVPGDLATLSMTATISPNPGGNSSTQGIFGSEQLNAPGHAVLNAGLPATLGTIALTTGATPTATSLHTPTPTPTATAARTATPTATVSRTATATVTATALRTPTATATPARTASITPTASATSSPAGTASATATRTSEPTVTATATTAATATATTRSTATATPTATATIALPPGHISVTPLSLAFAPMGIGAKPTIKSLAIKNLSRTNLLFGEIKLASGPFTIDPPPGEFALPPGKGEKISVAFSPLSIGPASATIEIDSNDPAQSEVIINLSGAGEGGVLSGPASVVFGPTRSGTTAKKTVVLKNTGKGEVSGAIPDVVGLFAISPPGPFSLQPGKTRSATITFSPSSPGMVETDFLIEVSPPGQPTNGLTIQVTGTGK